MFHMKWLGLFRGTHTNKNVFCSDTQMDHLILPPKGHIPREKKYPPHPEFPKHGEQDNYSLCKAAKYITNVLELSLHILEVNLVLEHYHMDCCHKYSNIILEMDTLLFSWI